jgi:sporadic carbohydrate cluster 2OG-Fe(II) oxygenase
MTPLEDRNTAAAQTARAPKGMMGHVVNYTATDRDTFLQDVHAQQFMLGRFGGHIQTLEYDTGRFDWQGVIRRALVQKGIVEETALAALESLSDLHSILPSEWTEVDYGELNKVSRAFYEAGEEFNALYRRFIRQVIEPECGEPVWWQETPTIRFHFPNQEGFGWKVCYHSDIMLGHPPQEVNVWLPLTTVYGTNAMCIAPFEASFEILSDVKFDFDEITERVEYDDDFGARCAEHARSLELRYGQFIMFDPRCLHATQRNRTPHTRISVDVRVLPKSQRERMKMQYRGTGRKRMLFEPGAYYDARLSSEI